MTFPSNLTVEEVELNYGSSLDFSADSSENNVNDFYDRFYEMDYRIKEFIEENLESIKTAANYNKLNAEIKDSNNKTVPKRKI